MATTGGGWAAEGIALIGNRRRLSCNKGHECKHIPRCPEQQQRLPNALQDWLPEGHLAYFISDTVDSLNLNAFHTRYAKDGPRNQPFHPAMMVNVLVYGYAAGVFSSRKTAKKLHEDIAFRGDRYVVRDLTGMRFLQFAAAYVPVYLVKLGVVTMLSEWIESAILIQALVTIPTALSSYLLMSKFVFQNP